MFNEEKFENLEVERYDVTTVGDAHLSEEEKKVLRLHPKFSVMQCLERSEMHFEL